MRALGLLFVCLMLVAPAVLAQSVDGEWEGEVEGRNGMQHITITLKANGGALTGKVTTPRGDNEIVDGKIEGGQITFNTPVSFGDNEFTISYSGNVSGDEIAFTRKIDRFNRTSKFTAKRKM